jgi:hypothetical protein
MKTAATINSVPLDLSFIGIVMTNAPEQKKVAVTAPQPE